MFAFSGFVSRIDGLALKRIEENKQVNLGERKGEKARWQYSKVKVALRMGEQTNLVTIQLNGMKQSFILTAKTFSTGSRGFNASGKMLAGEKNYQVSVNCVEIGSKPKEKEKKE